jgi:hypothetical protein
VFTSEVDFDAQVSCQGPLAGNTGFDWTNRDLLWAQIDVYKESLGLFGDGTETYVLINQLCPGGPPPGPLQVLLEVDKGTVVDGLRYCSAQDCPDTPPP